MSQCAQSSDGFVKGLFSPHVAVLCSQDAEIISQRNNLSFTQLIQPFCAINSEVSVHDPSNQVHIIKDLRITLCDLRSTAPDPSSVKQLLSSVVAEKSAGFDGSQSTWVETDKYKVFVNMSCPWFDAYREAMTTLAHPKQHEFVKHCIACLLVVTSSHPEPLEEFARLSQQQNYIQHQQSGQNHVRWMTPNTLKYYVLLHDSSHADESKAQKVINDLQAMHGKQACNMLSINSKSTNENQHLPDPWSRLLNWKILDKVIESNGLSMKNEALKVDSSTDAAPQADMKWVKDLKQSVNITEKGYGCCLTLADHENLKKFMHEFASQGLIPYMEKTIRICSEQIASRKAIHKSFFRATRSLFGGNKAASAPALKTLAGGAESQELQTRKLADLFFLCQMYEHAYYYYHSAKKDFSNEQAWLHAAGASEMAAFSNFMQPKTQRAYPAHYVDSALDTYSTTCSDDYLSLRCAFVSLECLRNKGLYAEAAAQLLKLSNDEDDLKSAMLLEQIAQCFLNTKRPLLRKFAFYAVLAGHRYGKAMQKACALSCYKYAFQVYKGCGWSLAQDHINFTIGRHSYNLKQLDGASEAFQGLLVKSKQPASQQALFLHEYLLVSSCKSDVENTITDMTIPLVELSKCTVESPEECMSNEAPVWGLMAQSVVDIASKEKPHLMIHTTSRKQKEVRYECVMGEQMTVKVHVTNPLNVPLAMHKATLVYDFKLMEPFSIASATVKELIIPENSETMLCFPITAKCVGELTIVGILYHLSIATTTGFNLPTSISSVQLSGRQLFTPDGKGGIEVKISSPMPLLKLEVNAFPTTLLSGQIACANLVLKNVGKRELHNLKVAYSSGCQCVFTDKASTVAHAKSHFLEHSHSHDGVQCQVQSLPNVCCKPDEETEMQLWLQGNTQTKSNHVHVMFYYEAAEYVKDSMFYRTLCYDRIVNLSPALELESTVFWENSQEGAVVSVDIKNRSKSMLPAFLVNGLFCDARTWHLETVGNTSFPMLSAQQDLRLCFKAKDKRTKLSNEELPKHQRLLFGAIKMDNADPWEPLKSISVHKVRLEGEGILNNHKFLTVALEWCLSEDNSVCGQHYLHLSDISKEQYGLSKIGLDPSAKVPSQDNSHSLAALHQLVKWKVTYQMDVENNFEQSRLCFVPVTIAVKNSYDCEVRVKVDGLDAGQNQLNNSPQFIWTGKALSKFILPPNGSHTLCMTACFVAPGVYNLNSFSVWAVPTLIEDKTPLLPQNCQYSCLLTVNNKIAPS